MHPLTDGTHDLIGEAEFAAMGPGTVPINVARGGIVDEGALIAALEQGTIRGATIDVARTEPRPADSPLWAAPNPVITAHQSGDGPRSDEHLDALFLDNLDRYVEGRPPPDVVVRDDPER